MTQNNVFIATQLHSRLPSPSSVKATNEATHKFFSSVDFQTCRLADSPQNRPGVKRALEVGLEIYAADQAARS
jgi:hypothetical protein